MFQPKSVTQYAAPTEEQYAVIKACYEKTGILTVKDAVTGKWVKQGVRCGGVATEPLFQGQTPYGQVRNSVEGAEVPISPSGFSKDEAMVRACYGTLVGTKRFPQGIIIGGFEVWRRDDFFDEASSYTCTRFNFDIWREEEAQLRAYAQDLPYVTDEMWNQKQKEADERRDHKAITQMDPVGTLVKSITEAMSARTLPPEALAQLEELKALKAKLAVGAGK